MVFPSQPDLDLSIIIVNYNAEKLLRECLESVFRFQKDLNFEMILIDNHSQDGSMEMVKKRFPQVRLVENKRNLGFSAACNQGIKSSRGRYLLLLNPDTEFTGGGVTGMIEFMESHRPAGICGPRMVDPEGKVQFSCRSFPSYLTAISSRQSVLNRLFPDNPLSKTYLLKDRNGSRQSEVDWVSGSAMLVRREVFEKIGLLDESFFMYVEDVDFCYRAKKANLQVHFVPEVTIVHHIGQSTRRRRMRMRVEHHRSMYRFYRKHFSPGPLLKATVFLGIWIRLCFAIWAEFIVSKGR
jgi:GT2 family glycosyltransferase